jgi:hypothetical protein
MPNLKTYAEATGHAPFDCDGACKRDGDCSGAIKAVEVLKNNESWGRFNYCESAIKTDERNGYEVRIFAQIEARSSEILKGLGIV